MERTLCTDIDGLPHAQDYRRIVAGLEPGPSVFDRPLPDLASKYVQEVCDAARCTWRDRMVNEHRSSAVFAALVPQLIEASSSIDTQAVVLRAAIEEIHHAELCGAVVRAFGGDAKATAEPVLPRIAEHPDASPLERVMRNVMFVGCLSETVAVALISAERDLSSEPFVREILTTILADEIAHARLGWLFLSRALPHLDRGARARTARYLRTAFAYLERHEIELLPLTPQFRSEVRHGREAVGLCEGTHARELFYRTIQDVIIPRFEELGIAATRAWATRSERTSRPTAAEALAPS